jgi:ABC-type Fe3+-hydroxamate transport system substrate-binding protein
MGRRELLFLRAHPFINSETRPLPISIAQRSNPAMTRGHRVRVILSFMAGLLLVACASSSCAPRNANPSDALSVTDEIGRTIKVKARPERIISLAPSITETLFALGLGDRVVGITSYCNYPPEAAQKEKLGDTMRPSIEKIIALKADLVIASTSSQLEQFVSSLDQVGVPSTSATRVTSEGCSNR